MKKISIFFLCLAIIFSVTACSRQNDIEITTAAPTTEEKESATVDPATPDKEESATAAPTAREETTSALSEQKWEWKKDTPENQDLNADALTEIRKTFDSFPLLSSVIVKNGYLVDEYYKEGYDETSGFLLHSASKSITSTLIGIAIERGYIESVEVPISEFFPQILEFDNEYWKEITIWHLLTHTSGIDSSDTEFWAEWRGSDNWVDFVLNRPVTTKPGSAFNYSTGNTHLLCAILQQATGMTAYEFGKEYLFDPLGMDSVQCGTDAQGISDGGNGFSMNVYDMAKFGQLFLNGGVWEKEQIVPTKWVEESTRLQFKRTTGSADYGYQWWVRSFGEAGYDAFFAQGHGGQYIFVVPQLELVVAFTSDYTGNTGIYWRLVDEIVEACVEP